MSNRITATNVFTGGMVSDLNAMSSPSNTAVDALNMEIITVGDEQNMYQNIRGNRSIVELPSHAETGFKYIPLGVSVSNNIAYIVAGAFDSSGSFLAGMVGTFPSPDWAALNADSPTTVNSSPLNYVFSPLHNFRKTGETAYTSPFISSKFSFSKNKFIDMAIQGDFDGSVNIIFTDGLESPLIINSRFKREGEEDTVFLADRLNDNDSNTYSDDDWERIFLIQNSNIPIQVTELTIPDGGYLYGGGYRYLFKYITQEGNTTDVLYESPLIPIANGGLGLDRKQTADKSISFKLAGLDSSYTGLQVYFAHFDGEDAAKMELFKIKYVYRYPESGELVITHSGLEEVESIQPSELTAAYSVIDTAQSLAIVNDRLAFAGVSATLAAEDMVTLEEVAKKITLWERTVKITTDYSDPKTAAEKLGYWPGEVYEFGAVFLLAGKGLSPVFPVTGMDNFSGAQAIDADFSGGEYPQYTLDADGFSSNNLINNKGLFRFSMTGIFYEPGCKDATRTVRYINADTSILSTPEIGKKLEKISTGFFLVRRPRVKNVLMQGMMTPTVKLPDKFMPVSPYSKPDHLLYIGSSRYLVRHRRYEPRIGLNARYKAVDVTEKGITRSQFDVGFNTVYAPQVTQAINIVAPDKVWWVCGQIAQEGVQGLGRHEYATSVTQDGTKTSKMHMAFISCELDMNYPSIRGYLNGVNPALEVMSARFWRFSPVGRVVVGSLMPGTNKPSNKTGENLIVRAAEPIGFDIFGPNKISSEAVSATMMVPGIAVYADGAFTSKVDRSLGMLSARGWTSPGFFLSSSTEYLSFIAESAIRSLSFTGPKGLAPYVAWDNATQTRTDATIMQSSSKHNSGIDDYIAFGFNDDHDFRPISLINHSYSSYLGIVVDEELLGAGEFLPKFRYATEFSKDFRDVSNSTIEPCKVGAERPPEVGGDTHLFTNVGHLANVFRSAAGRWGESQLRDLYKYDSNAPYHSMTDRVALSTKALDIFRGDGFISRIFKRMTYKNGVTSAPGASQTDMALYGTGLSSGRLSKDFKYDELKRVYSQDEGLGLLDNGSIIELISYSNINADIRSTERVSPAESALHSGDRDFYPNSTVLFGDDRPDSAGYNHGYTGDVYPLAYFRIEENTPVLNSSFPNRILLSPRNTTQSFFNSFRDIKGFNYRDYGIELGPIMKIITLKGVLVSVHPTGVLAIGIDDRTLLSEGSDIFINTAESLSPKAFTISDTHGTQHPESVIRTDITIVGVDYRLSAIWMFAGQKLTVLSEFAVKTVLDGFKKAIETGVFEGSIAGASYIPRVYSTYDKIKHTLLFSYVAQVVGSNEQLHVGSITYNTVMRTWVSRLSEGTKFSFTVGANTLTTGFSDQLLSVDAGVGVWEGETLTDPLTGESIRNTLRGIQYTYEFAFIIGEQLTVEKILDNIKVVCNKELPDEIVYTVSGDVNTAALNVWGNTVASTDVTQKIVTRESSGRGALGILDCNANYDNSILAIEVGRMARGGIPSATGDPKGQRRIKDKRIKVRFRYTGNSETFIQAVFSVLRGSR